MEPVILFYDLLIAILIQNMDNDRSRHERDGLDQSWLVRITWYDLQDETTLDERENAREEGKHFKSLAEAYEMEAVANGLTLDSVSEPKNVG